MGTVHQNNQLLEKFINEFQMRYLRYAKTGSKHGHICDVSGDHVATNSHVCVVAGFKSRPIFSFALASIWHEQSHKAGTRATE